MRLGVLGGTFDPPHTGHLLIAGDAIDALGLDRLILIPAAVQPLKVGQSGASPPQRLAMVRALIADDPRLDVDPMEVERGGLSYSVDTLEELARRHPGAELFFVVGADVVATIGRWRRPERIAELARIVVLRRGEEAVESGGEGGADASLGDAIVLPTRRIDISSTEVRERVRKGQSIRGFVPEAVASYIAAAQLYR